MSIDFKQRIRTNKSSGVLEGGGGASVKNWLRKYENSRPFAVLNMTSYNH